MAVQEENRKIFSLFEVTGSIQRTLAQRYTRSFWVKAEMNKLNHYPHSGHCYPDLVEKADGRVIAQMKATLWKDDFHRINENFLSVVKSPLKDGIKMLFCARITFDPVYGLTLRITDIDPVFSLGELEREKQESLARLKEQGLFHANKSLAFPLLPKRIAIISVETSKGYADFNKVIDDNPWGYKFIHVLFPSLLQGDRAVDSIRTQLDRIRKMIAHFDVVAIIRGGGGEVGLSCFNDFSLAKDIATFPLPVLTGIGHATNETVVEMVSYKNAITPTELADYLLQKFHDFATPVRAAEEMIVAKSKRLIAEARQTILHTTKYFRSVAAHVLTRSQHDIQDQARNLFRQSNMRMIRGREMHNALAYKLRSHAVSLCRSGDQSLSQNHLRLQKSVGAFVRLSYSSVANIKKTVDNLHPGNVLKRGYSITRIRGLAVNSAGQVAPSDTLETILADGTVISTATAVTKSSDL